MKDIRKKKIQAICNLSKTKYKLHLYWMNQNMQEIQ